MRVAILIATVVAAAGCAGGAASTPSTSSIAAGACPRDGFCFNVLAGGPGPLGPSRLILMWSAPDHKSDSAPDLVELGNLTGQERSVFVPRSAIRPPARSGELGVTWGYVFAVSPNAPATSTKNAVGIAQMMLTDAKSLATQLPLGEMYPAGLAPGIAGYRMVKVAGRSHDKFFLAPPGAVFDLVVCPVVQPQCRLPAPNPN